MSELLLISSFSSYVLSQEVEFAICFGCFFAKLIPCFYSLIGFFLGRPRLTSFLSIVCLFSILLLAPESLLLCIYIGAYLARTSSSSASAIDERDQTYVQWMAQSERSIPIDQVIWCFVRSFPLMPPRTFTTKRTGGTFLHTFLGAENRKRPQRGAWRGLAGSDRENAYNRMRRWPIRAFVLGRSQ